MEILLEDEKQTEPNPEEIAKLILDGQATIDELEEDHTNGQISDETYNAVLDIVNAANMPTSEDLINKLSTGEISEDDLITMLSNGEITQDTYNEVIDVLNSTDPEQVAEENVAQEEPTEPVPLSSSYNNAALFDKFIELKEFIKAYKEAYKDVEIDELSEIQTTRLSYLYKCILELENNLYFYMNNNFKNEEYKKNLYTYLLFNKEFTDELSKFRNALNLNPNELIKEKEENKKKN